MAFPAVDASDCPFSDGSGNISLPSVDAGDRLIVGAFSSVGAAGITASDSLQLLKDTDLGGGNFITSYQKVIDGSEGGSVQLDGVGFNYCFLFVLSGDDNATPPEAADATGSGSAADPPNLTPSWGAADTTWLEVGFSLTSGITAVSTNYTARAASFDDTFRLGSRELNASSENPGTMTQASSGTWAAQTIAVRPAGGGGGSTVPVKMHSYRQRRV